LAGSSLERNLSIDTEAHIGITLEYLQRHDSLVPPDDTLTERAEGSFSCALLMADRGKLVLMSNTGSLYLGRSGRSKVFASERAFLVAAGIEEIRQVVGMEVWDVPVSMSAFDIVDRPVPRPDLIPPLVSRSVEEKALVYPQPTLRRCARCVLPETMPFIRF
jgi:glutamine phosphoribosylpyrophosphate amidotransferase